MFVLCCAGGDEVRSDTDTTTIRSTHLSNGTSKSVELGEIETKQTPSDNTQPKPDDVTDAIHLPSMNIFLGDKFAKFICLTPTRICVVLVYCGLLAGAIYGIFNLEEVSDGGNAVPDGSYYKSYFRKYRRDFTSEYGPNVQVAITESLDFTDQTVLDNIDSLIEDFQNNEYFVEDDSFVVSWLRDYLSFLNQINVNVTDLDMTQFIDILENQFFPLGSAQFYKIDVVFNDARTEIVTSRFFMQSGRVDTSLRERSMMLDARKIADDFAYDAEVYSLAFPFYDQFVVITSVTLTNLGIAVASMLVVSCILIPSISTIIWVTLATVSICALVIGYMALWDVALDSISMINLVMSIGFSVDFAAHISYHYVSHKDKDPKAKITAALGYLGTPIVQGAASTILGVLFLAFSNTYIFRTFFKLTFMVIAFGFFHAMFLLPVVLSTLDCAFCCSKQSNSKVSDSRSNSPQHNKTASSNGVDNHSYEGKYT